LFKESPIPKKENRLLKELSSYASCASSFKSLSRAESRVSSLSSNRSKSLPP